MTGGGLGGNDQDPSQDDSQDASMELYVSSSGPTDSTPLEARNLWGMYRIFV